MVWLHGWSRVLPSKATAEVCFVATVSWAELPVVLIGPKWK